MIFIKDLQIHRSIWLHIIHVIFSVIIIESFQIKKILYRYTYICEQASNN